MFSQNGSVLTVYYVSWLGFGVNLVRRIQLAATRDNVIHVHIWMNAIGCTWLLDNNTASPSG
jgi:hypothetical protein